MNTKRYVVRFEQTSWLWANVAVDATNQEDAQNRALQQFDLLTTKCRCQECDTRVVSEDGERVEWCERAFVKDWKNPYRKVASPAREVKAKEPTTEQTDGKPLPEVGQVTGEPGEHLAALKRVLLRHRIALEYHDDLGGALGRSCNGTIKLVRGLTPAREFAVLAHELAHELMHQGNPTLDRNRAEIEAEGVASVLCRFAGLDAGSAHSDYIRLYPGGREALTDSLEVIQRTASRIIEAMAGAEEVGCDGQTESNQPPGRNPGTNSKEDHAELD